MSRDFVRLSAALTDALSLHRPPVAICFAEELPPGVAPYAGQAPAGCLFWQEAANATFATAAVHHALCSIGVYTHRLEMPAPVERDLQDALKVFGDLGYVRPEDLAAIPTLPAGPRYVVYSPLASAPLNPDVVLLFVQAAQTLILSEATQQVEGGFPPALGRPACAIVPQAANSGRGALSLGCCGARAYLDALIDDIALFALPGARLEAYVERIEELAKANATLARFHRLRRDAVASGAMPTVADSLAALSR